MHRTKQKYEKQTKVQISQRYLVFLKLSLIFYQLFPLLVCKIIVILKCKLVNKSNQIESNVL